jgi:hypothetical protein
MVKFCLTKVVITIYSNHICSGSRPVSHKGIYNYFTSNEYFFKNFVRKFHKPIFGYSIVVVGSLIYSAILAPCLGASYILLQEEEPIRCGAFLCTTYF